MSDKTTATIEDKVLSIPSSKGTIAGTLYTPSHREEPLPVLLMSIPYRKDDYITYGAYDPLIRYLANHDYHVVVTDLLGTGASSGFKSEHTAFTGNEATEVIEWLADQEWTTGEVGMFGKSYGGRTTLAAAVERPPPLKAIVPISAPFAAYDDSKYQGGSLNFFKQAGDFCPLVQTLFTMPPSRRDTEGEWVEVWRERLDAMTKSKPWLFEFLEHDHKDGYWQGKDIDVEKIDIPVFAITGWRDYYPHASLEHLSNIDAPTRILIGPWRHTMPHRGFETAVDGRAQIQEWFDHFLKDEDNGARTHSPIEYWTEQNGEGQSGSGQWRGRDGWPHVDNSDGPTLSFALTQSGLLPAGEFTAESSVETTYDFDQTVGINSIDYLTPNVDATPDDVRSLTFETEPLSEAIEFTGTGEAAIRITPTVNDHLLVVRVLDVNPDGGSSLVTFGRLRASQRDSFKDPDLLTPGQEYEIQVPLKPKSHIFEAGHRIRVAISASYFPLMLAPRYQGSFTVSSNPDDPSILRFPGRIRESEAILTDGINMNSPTESPVPPSSPYVTVHESTWKTGREHETQNAQFITHEAKTIDLPHAKELHWERKIKATVQADDPLTAKVQSDTTVRMEYESEVVTVYGSSHATTETAVLTQQVQIDNETIYNETWRW